MPGRLARMPACAACVVFLFALSACACAQEAKPPIDIDAEAGTVMADFGAYSKSLNAFRVTIKTQISGGFFGKDFEQSSSLLLSAKRPDKVAFAFTTSNAGESKHMTLSSDGVNCAGAMIISGPARRFAGYTIDEAPTSWNEIIRNRFASTAMNSATVVPVAVAMLSDDPAAWILSKLNVAVAKSVTYAGRETLDGVECHVICSVADSSTQNAGQDFDWQLWIEAGDRPLVRQSMVTPGGITAKFFKVNIVTTYQDWQIDPPIPEDTFVFVRPEGTVEIASFAELLAAGEPPAHKRDAAKPHPLVGQVAPPVELSLLDGGTFDLSDCKGENVVILDFWSTACLPCIQALPIVEGVAREFETKGVRLYAVNVGQTAEEARTFLENVNWSGKIPVLLDEHEEVATAYSASTMPHLVLIGKDGIVRAVRVGKSKDLASQLRSDLKSLLAGKNLAAKEPATAKKPSAEDAGAK